MPETRRGSGPSGGKLAEIRAPHAVTCPPAANRITALITARRMRTRHPVGMHEAAGERVRFDLSIVREESIRGSSVVTRTARRNPAAYFCRPGRFISAPCNSRPCAILICACTIRCRGHHLGDRVVPPATRRIHFNNIVGARIGIDQKIRRSPRLSISLARERAIGICRVPRGLWVEVTAGATSTYFLISTLPEQSRSCRGARSQA